MFTLENYSTQINNPNFAQKLIENINNLCNKLPLDEINIMEVCGTHTHEIFKSGIKSLLPKKIKLKSGPGCPVCVTTNDYIEAAIALAYDSSKFIIATFGDMLKVPTSFGISLHTIQNLNLNVKVIYSPDEVILIAKENPNKNVIFLSVGFETTVASIAYLVKEVKNQNINNVFILEGNKTVPNAILTIATHPLIKIHGFLLPGHVSAIIGIDGYNTLFNKICGVISGFEYIDILMSINLLLKLILKKELKIENTYQRVVSKSGNSFAQKLIYEVFEITNSTWRGIGIIPNSGLKLNKNYIKYSAFETFKDEILNLKEAVIKKFKNNFSENLNYYENCHCGEVLLSLIEPKNCPLFSNVCTPITPIGPCMVSSEGACAAYYKYKNI